MTSYVPILKARRAELAALSLLDAATKDGIRPVIELSMGTGTDQFAQAMHQRWDEGRLFYVDLVRGRPPSQTLVPRASELAAVAEGCRLRGLRMMPVISLTQAPDYQEVARELGSRAGLMLRLQVDMTVDPHDLQVRVRDLLRSLRLPPGIVDLLVDFGHLPNAQPASVAGRVRDVLDLAAAVGGWRMVGLASTSFPRDLSSASRPLPDAVLSGRAPRNDWALWQQIATARTSGPTPLFSDYGIQHPIDTEQPAHGGFPLIPNIRYASQTSWLLLRGRDLNQYRSPTFRDLCRVLTTQPEFMGAAFSRGDQYLQDCADKEIVSPRDYPAWRLPSFVHHITLVVRQLSDFRSGSEFPASQA